jgi:hypothetical protein
LFRIDYDFVEADDGVVSGTGLIALVIGYLIYKTRFKNYY